MINSMLIDGTLIDIHDPEVQETHPCCIDCKLMGMTYREYCEAYDKAHDDDTYDSIEPKLTEIDYVLFETRVEIH